MVMLDKEYFDPRMLYYGLDEFFMKRLIIKSLFKCKSFDEQYMYRLYVNSRPFINDSWKDRIWEYIQGDINDETFRFLYDEFMDKKRVY